jgi:hypothetical protein
MKVSEFLKSNLNNIKSFDLIKSYLTDFNIDGGARILFDIKNNYIHVKTSTIMIMLSDEFILDYKAQLRQRKIDEILNENNTIGN